MSNQARRHTQRHTVESSQNLLRKVEQEIAEGYFEVEITGLSFRRLSVAYAVLVRNAWSHTLENLRSLLRPTPAL